MVAHVPWARHGAGHTLAFDETVAWLATQCSKTAVTELMRIAWRTVGAIITRVWADIDALGDRLDGLTGSGSTRSPTSVAIATSPSWSITTPAGWCGPRRAGTAPPCAASSTSSGQTAAPRSPTCRPIRPTGSPRSSPNGARTRCSAPTRSTSSSGPPTPSTRSAVKPGTTPAEPGRPRGKGYRNRVATGDARRFKNARYALWKNPENLTDRQRDKLAWIAKTDPRLHRAYLLKEGLRYVFAVKGEAGKRPWTDGCPGPAAAASPPSSTSPNGSAQSAPHIDATLEHGLSNALIESVNTKIRLITRVAFGFRSADSPHRPRHAQPRRAPTRPTRPHQTHGSVSRAAKSGALNVV